MQGPSDLNSNKLCSFLLHQQFSNFMLLKMVEVTTRSFCLYGLYLLTFAVLEVETVLIFKCMRHFLETLENTTVHM